MNTLLAARQWNATVIIPVSLHAHYSQEGRMLLSSWLSVDVLVTLPDMHVILAALSYQTRGYRR